MDVSIDQLFSDFEQLPTPRLASRGDALIFECTERSRRFGFSEPIVRVGNQISPVHGIGFDARPLWMDSVSISERKDRGNSISPKLSYVPRFLERLASVQERQRRNDWTVERVDSDSFGKLMDHLVGWGTLSRSKAAEFRARITTVEFVDSYAERVKRSGSVKEALALFKYHRVLGLEYNQGILSNSVVKWLYHAQKYAGERGFFSIEEITNLFHGYTGTNAMWLFSAKCPNIATGIARCKTIQKLSLEFRQKIFERKHVTDEICRFIEGCSGLKEVTLAGFSSAAAKPHLRRILASLATKRGIDMLILDRLMPKLGTAPTEANTLGIESSLIDDILALVGRCTAEGITVFDENIDDAIAQKWLTMFRRCPTLIRINMLNSPISAATRQAFSDENAEKMRQQDVAHLFEVIQWTAVAPRPVL